MPTHRPPRPPSFDAELPASIRRLLHNIGQDLEAPYDRRIYTNRDLSLDSIGVIGFDMDYTLATYNQERIEEISIKTTTDKLISRGYPERLSNFDPDPRFAVRGLMVDKQLGNVIKMDRHGYVGRAYHGHQQLSDETRKATYREQRLGKEHERFAAVDTLFALPEVTLYAEVVSLIDEYPEAWSRGRPPSYNEAWLDVRECIDEAHRDGSIKERIRANPGEYIDRDPDLPQTLHKFRSGGKKLFLLTNSFFPYTDTVLHYLLGGDTPYEDWTAYFDWMVVGSAKPGFFSEGAPFQELDRSGNPIGPQRQDVQRGKIYQGGNQLGLQTSFGCCGDEVLYVGDHIYGDIVKSKKSSGWRTALVVQELQRELQVRRARGMTLREISHLYELRSQLAELITAQRHLGRVLARLTGADLARHAGLPDDDAEAVLLDARANVRHRLDRLRDYESETLDTLNRRSKEVDEAFNPYWGSSFAERHDTSRFGAQVESYACVYTSRVSNFLYVSPAKYFISPHNALPHWS